MFGVQTAGNLDYLKNWHRPPERKIEVLQNWLANAVLTDCSLQVSTGALVNRKIFVYAGNMGVAQGMDIIVGLAERLRDRRDVGFLFVGRGSEVSRLAGIVRSKELTNTVFHPEVSPEEIPSLYAQCHVGIVALDPRTHTIYQGSF